MPPKAKKPNTSTGLSKPLPVPATESSNNQQLKSAESHQPAASQVNGQHANDKRDSDSKTGDTTESAGEANTAPSVNRKKQKRREKEAAKRVAQQDLSNGHAASVPTQHTHSQHHPPPPRGPAKGYFTEEVDHSHPGFADVGSPDDAFYSGDDDPEYDNLVSGHPDTSWLNTSRRKKSRKQRGSAPDSTIISRTSTTVTRPNFPSVSNAALRSAHRMGDSLWNPSTQAERENIKQFWLDLGEEERRSLVKIEKEAVLRKMKEQQKHSCSCSVCGRKRTAIEEELEVLYDAYYEELEQFANHDPDLANAPQLMAPPRPMLRRGPQPIPGSFSSRGRVQEVGDDDEDFDEDDEYDDDDEPYSDEDEDDLDLHGLPPGPPDFFQFGNSLTVKDGILTVADDLLKNDGRHFIDMMEQLAERRMQREEEVHFPSAASAHQDVYQGHNHAPLDEEDDYDDEEDDEDYDSQEEDDFEGDEMDSMTEEQRMEEGRRMFQIFAARMFEQRVLTAYREKVAAERQARLLEELDEENRLDTQREAKKAREAAKKKEKKKAHKAAKDEEKAKKDADKIAQETAAREAEERKLEEQRQRKEEQRKKRETERKAADEDRLKKEAEKLRRQQEQKEKQADAERKTREAKEREKQKREDAKKQEREDREAKEKETRERKAKEAQERKVKEEQARKDKAEAAARTENQMKEKMTQYPTPRPQPVALPPGLHPPSRGPPLQSPNLAIATPVMPVKVPSRQVSGPATSHSSSPRSQQMNIEQFSTSPANIAIPHPASQTPAMKTTGQPPMLHHPQPSAPRSPLNNPGRNQHAFAINGLQGLGVSAPPNGPPVMMPGMMPQMPMYQGPPMGHHPRFGPNGMQYPQNFGGPRHFQPSQPMPFHAQGSVNAPIQAPQNNPSRQPHSRQPSGSTTTEASSQPAPIARPGPIARPASTTPDRQKSKEKVSDQEVEQIATQLGSKALLDDSDEPLSNIPSNQSSLPPVGAPGTGRLPFASSFESKQDAFSMAGQGWSGFGAAPGWGAPGPQRSGAPWPQQPFGAMNHAPPPMQRSHLPRPMAVRVMLVQACRQLASSGENLHPVQSVLHQLEMMKPPGEPLVSMDEMLAICDTEGNAQNGGGSFEVMMDKARGQVIKFTEDIAPPKSSVGDIGSPVPGHAQPSSFAVGFGRGF